MRIRIVHEIDAPLEAVERAVLSAELAPELERAFAAAGSKIESVKTMAHELEGGRLRRVLRFQAGSPLAALSLLGARAGEIAREAMSWDETFTYELEEHAARWVVAPRPRYQKYFRSEGSYRLEDAGRRTKRKVEGELVAGASLARALVERVALAEVERTYAIEAETLQKLASE